VKTQVFNIFILKFGKENDELKYFRKIVFIFEKLKFSIFRRVTIYSSKYWFVENFHSTNRQRKKPSPVDFTKTYAQELEIEGKFKT
jgi:hypothetical protein